MFTKLLKHEWLATRGSLGTLCLVSLAASLLGGLTMRYLVWASTAQGMENQFLGKASGWKPCIQDYF